MSHSADIAALLAHWRDGDCAAFDRVFPLVYAQLRQAAAAQLRRVSGADTISPTALLSDVFLKLATQADLPWHDRGHFMAVASKAMRHILLNHAQVSRGNKRGGDWFRVTGKYNELQGAECADTLLAVEEALEYLAAQDARLAQVVELRFFGALTEAEIGEVLGINEPAARRDWCKAEAMLAVTMDESRIARQAARAA